MEHAEQRGTELTLNELAVDLARLEEKIAGNKVAVDVAATDINRRLEAANELRAQIASERGSYLLREMYDREHAALSQRVSNLELAASRVAGSIWAMGATISVLVSVITLALHFLAK